MIEIRRAKADDVSILADLGARTFLAAFGQDNSPEDINAYVQRAFNEETLLAEFQEPTALFILAYEDSDAVGYAKLIAGRLPGCVQGPDPVELQRIYVDASVIGKGYGAALMNRCFLEAKGRGHATVWLGVWEKNNRALAFYEKWGFRRVGSHEFLLGSDLQTDLILECAVG